MDYKEKYENGVECIQEILSGAADLIRTSTLRKRLQPFFPELKKNEDKDERIRKDLTEFLKSASGGFLNSAIPCETFGEWLEWLEKQSEQESIDYNEELRKCRENPLYFIDKYVKFEERKPAWSKEDEKIKESIKKVLANTNFNKLDIKYSFYEMISWLEKQKDNIKLPNSAYTSNKDVIEFADKYSHDVWEKLMDNFKKIENYHIGCNDVSDIVLNAIINTCNWLEKQGKKKHIFGADDILPYLGNNQVQDILEDMGMLDDNGQCPHTAEEIFKAGMEHAFNLNREAASNVKVK